MPFPRQYAPEKRITIFLDFRLRQKVYPVAKKHNVARSTVSGIIDEFVNSGFSATPRLDVSAQLLSRMQEMHILEMVSSLGQLESLTMKSPMDYMLGGLRLEEALHGESLPSGQEPLENRESLIWHLKGTEEASLIKEVSEAAEDYDRRCLALWQDIRRPLEEATGLSVRSGPQGEEPALYRSLVDMLYRIALDPERRGKGLKVILDWYFLGEGPSALSAVARYGSEEPFTLAERVQVAYVDKTSRGLVQRAVDDYLKANLADLTGRAEELTLMYHDMVYVFRALREAIKDVSREKVREGICPQCPYPEVLVRTDKDSTRKVSRTIKDLAEEDPGGE